jgi:hypothetical protein
MEAFMLNDRNIEEVIKSRQDLSASGIGGISYRILKAAGKEGVKFIKLLVRTCIRNRKIIQTWKEARPILIHKKGNRDAIQNSRPISIMNCVYRIFTGLLARAIQATNSKLRIYSDNQKGFIKITNGCSEHGIMPNNRRHDARRNNESLIVTAIDFTNAFGSVPHERIMSLMQQRNFPQWTQDIVGSMYQGATSVIKLGGMRFEKIEWKRDAKQGCPLGLLLLNLCPEPLFYALDAHCERWGAFVGPAKEQITFTRQAYADDIILIAHRSDNIEKMLEVLEYFRNCLQMGVNVKKCATDISLLDINRRQCSLRDQLKFKGQQIPNLTLGESLKYLGTAIAARR